MAVSSRRQFSAEKGICHMSETTITQLPDPSGFSSDPFTEVLRNGARCPSSDNSEQLSAFSFGGSGSFLIEFRRFQFGDASAA
jgi:hypothetical protein